MLQPIIINNPVERIIEREYGEGYSVQPQPAYAPPEQPRQADTEPLFIVQQPMVMQPPAQQQMQPERNIHHEHPTRSPERDTQTIRNEPESKARHDPETVDPVRKSPVGTPARSEPKKLTPVDKEKFNVPDKKKFNTPLIFSPPEQASQANPRKKLQHKKRNPGRQRKYHQTISLLEEYANGDTDQFDKLDPQMQRYYRREYSEYFGRDSKRSSEQRLTNRTKAARTKRESERRRIVEISRNHADAAV